MAALVAPPLSLRAPTFLSGDGDNAESINADTAEGCCCPLPAPLLRKAS